MRESSLGKARRLRRLVSQSKARIAFDPTGDGKETPDARRGRTIPSSLIAERLKSGASAGGSLEIVGAVFQGNLDLRSALTEHAISLVNCEFEDEVDFSGTTLSSGICLDDCHFDGAVRFRAAKIHGDFSAV